MVHVLLANVQPSSEGLVGSIITLVAASFSSVPRQATWYNFFISWIVYCASYLLLFFAGHAYDEDPGISLCIAQSTLTRSAPSFVAACSLALVIQFIDANNSEEGLVQLDIILAILPVVAIIIFGTHKDLLNVYLFWRKDGPQFSSAKTEKPLPPIPSQGGAAGAV
ncbi:uncharacterized protein C8R40DRAFT_1074938 [Lentinula edodes]|uniref:uncharacterized protein n=1 Tax=Lentinula edodes TaxID=5353 RepID=UPI001E8EC9AA|nr:uncharacterized protein C8R40DRAFT_1074938 [Lentinula edodes]KAH7868343.1 hypothetical protein C8R40DRAFT_1074938 [Lentinula edodes]